MLTEVCRVIVQDVGYRLAWIGYKEENKEKHVFPVGHYGFNDGYIENANILWSKTERGSGPTGTSIRALKPVICHNMVTDEKFKPWREEAIKRGFASSIALPIIINNNVIGALTIYATEPNAFNKEEVTLLHELTENLSFGISHIRQNKINREITERLNESEERYRNIFNETSLAILIIKPDTLEIIDVNEKACLFYGYSRDEFLKKMLMDIQTLPGEELKVIASKVVTKKQDFLITRHRTSSGEIKDVEIYTGPIKIKGNDYICSTIHDITQRKRMEEEIRLSNENMINGYAYCEMVYDENNNPEDFIYLAINKSFEKLTGLKGDDVINRRVTEVIPGIKESNSELIEIYGNIASVGSAEQFEVFFKPLNIWLNISAYSPKKGYFVTIFENTTERKAVEMALRDSEEKYRLLFTHENDAIFLCDTETLEFIDANDAWYKLYGYSIDEMKGKSAIIISAEPDKTIETVNAVIITGSTRVPQRYHKRKDGTVFSVELSMGVFVYRGRKVLCVISRDITEQIRLEEELRYIAETLEHRVTEEIEKNRLKDQLMYEQSRHMAMGDLLVNIAHQWRQPLASIGVLVQDIKDAYLFNELNAEYLDRDVTNIMSELVGLSDTIDSFKNFYLSNLQKEELRIKNVIDSALEVSSGYFELKDILIEKELDEELTINAVPSEFTQIVLNILSNIRDVFEQRQITNRIVKIKAYKEPDTNKTIITIADNGGGVRVDIIDRIFEPYFTTKDKTRGTGLGLYITKLIVEKSMKGTITVRNIDGWCEFRIEI
ncbi:MAG: PAS domain S-box protein [Nitrospirae bacterium]|nr:PAS domain S-box protein [Nitrospirota bacterium]